MTEHRITPRLRADQGRRDPRPNLAIALWQETAEAFRALHDIQFAAPWKDGAHRH